MVEKRIIRGLAAWCCLLVSSAGLCSDAPSVVIDAVQQRWPWNNKVDITYTVANGGENLAEQVYRKLVFTATVGGTVHVIDGGTVGARASDGTHTVTWLAPEGVKSAELGMKAALYASDLPSGDDYMIVDLATGAVTYEGLLATQDASNARYNTKAYKTTKMVFRKVAKGLSYTIGDDDHYDTTGLFSTSRTWTPAYDFYVAIFECTIVQWKTIFGSDYDSSVFTYFNNYNGDSGECRAAHSISWNMLRGSGTLPTATLVPDAKGTVLQRLNAKTAAASGIKGFDLPTEVMFEIACRAGKTTAFFWGDDVSAYADYVVCKESYDTWMTDSEETNKTRRPRAVGSLKPNDWGLYDMSGNQWEWCRDDISLTDLASATDPFVPAYAGKANRRMHGGGPFNNDILGSNKRQFYCSFRNTMDPGNTGLARGFRVAWVRK